MRANEIGLATALALAASAPPLLAHQPTPTAAQPATLPASARGAAAAVDAFHASLRRGDVRAAAALLADDALIFESGGAERSKAEYAKHHLPADAAFSQAVSSVVTRRQGKVAGKLAWIASEGRITGNYKGKALNLVTTETMVLRQVGNAWRIIHIHWSSEQQP